MTNEINTDDILRGDKWSDDELELFERQRCKAVKDSVASCEYAGLKRPFNKSMIEAFQLGASAIYVTDDGISNVNQEDMLNKESK
jgi:hypothetical protein